MLKDISKADNGLYQCTVANHVGYSVCVVEVKVSGRCTGREVSGLGELEGWHLGSAFQLETLR